MKTAMQEHINWLKNEYISIAQSDLGIALHIGDCIENAESMLEKEKEQIINAASIVLWNNSSDSTKQSEQYYNDTYGKE